jgi:hypothetical protein
MTRHPKPDVAQVITDLILEWLITLASCDRRVRCQDYRLADMLARSRLKEAMSLADMPASNRS